jgi:flagellin-specific chaperone FliS
MYSPNLNIIERYWKWLKKKCLNCKYYDTFEKFKNAIDKSLTMTINHENKTELNTLLLTCYPYTYNGLIMKIQ